MWELDNKQGWVLKNWCFLTVVFRRLLRVPCTATKSSQSILKEISPEYSLEGLMLTEAPILWPPYAKSWLTGKDPSAGKDWRQEKMEMTEDEMLGWHHWFDGHEFEQVARVGDGQGSLVCCSPCGCKESDGTEPLNWMVSNFAFTKTLYIDLPPTASMEQSLRAI